MCTASNEKQKMSNLKNTYKVNFEGSFQLNKQIQKSESQPVTSTNYFFINKIRNELLIFTEKEIAEDAKNDPLKNKDHHQLFDQKLPSLISTNSGVQEKYEEDEKVVKSFFPDKTVIKEENEENRKNRKTYYPPNTAIQEENKEDEIDEKKIIILKPKDLNDVKHEDKVKEFNFDWTEEEEQEFLKNHPKKERPSKFKTFTDL